MADLRLFEIAKVAPVDSCKPWAENDITLHIETNWRA